MINTILLKEIIVNHKKIFLNKKKLFQREILNNFYNKYKKLREVLVITGIRRCGKSSLMRLIWDEFSQKEKIGNEQFFYLNFEDERFVDFDYHDFSKILDVYYELNNPQKNKKIFLFLDEIQNIKYWEKWINRLYEEDKYKIFITGSNATLLSSELATNLTGRNLCINLYPLSFYEYLVYFKEFALKKDSFFAIKSKAKIKNILEEYIEFGGMPEYIKNRQTELIQEYFKNIIMRDIVNRYNIRYKSSLHELAHILLANLCQISSLEKLRRITKIKNINTVKNYLDYLENSFLFSRLSLFSFSYKTQVYNPDKIYCCDLGFFNSIAFQAIANQGIFYENLVFTHLKAMYEEIFYYKDKNNYEVDFLTKHKNKITNLIQVSYIFKNQETIDREERSLINAMDEFNLGESFIINKDIDEEKKIGRKKIIYKPLWKFLLER